ncbi:MAG: hypothetical protein B7Y45_05310 [Sphingomonas sp. 28-66-16]|nr:MAG: hypothetical protein B7Y45_05310 [Sphingomonas sp. 28-66-16]
MLTVPAFLVEKDPASFAQLRQAKARYPKIEVIPLDGKMEDHAAAIAASIPQQSFSFTLIDPKGFPAIGSMMPLLRRQNAEALVNFMFDFANRFGGTDLIPTLEAWLSTSAPDDWRERIRAVSGEQREQLYEELAVEALRRTPGYVYAPVITVDKVLHNRALYKLIFLTRHSEGLKVYRDSERSALDAQATTRSALKAKKRDAGRLMDDLFADGSDAIPNDRSTQVVRRSEAEALRRLQAMLTNASSGFCTWKECWPMILAELSVTHSWLGRQVNDLRKAGQISAPGWPSERTQIPRDEQRLKWSG